MIQSQINRNIRLDLADAEISIEVDPREIELDVLDHLRAEGFNRLSMGVQDFNKEVHDDRGSARQRQSARRQV